MRSKIANTTERFWTPLRLVSTAIVFSLVAMFGISSCNSTDEKSAPVANKPRIVATTGKSGDPATTLPMLPPNVLNAELPASSGEPIKLSSYSGKVLVVNLWATWCGPCRVEIPELVKLYKEYQPKGVEIVGLSTEDPDDQEVMERVKTFVKNYNVDYRVGWATNEVALTLMQGHDAIPQSFVITRDGHIVKRFVGFNATATPPQIRQAIEDALKQG